MKKIVAASFVFALCFNCIYPQKITVENLADFFPGKDAAFVLYNLNADKYIKYNPERCSQQFLPASTFKIFNSLVGLETGVIKNEDYTIKWDGTQYDIKSWNGNQSMKTAFKNSVVWYYQEVARRIGRSKMQRYLNEVGYGNMVIGSDIDKFWLDGSLQISADEQIEFLKRLYDNALPFSERTMQIVKNVMIIEQNKDYVLRGKTGLGKLNPKKYIAWFVGWIEKGKDVYFFAMNMNGEDADKLIKERLEITENLLRYFQIIK
ncbi:class D beta-lactamase [Melioribacteraceae bacterium 4301-Me]|uniref:class D beta-lactamase n=1 Tax=Pyranulibacter aquaticus TaxID=3163344 RepID=UPI00359B120B